MRGVPRAVPLTYTSRWRPSDNSRESVKVDVISGMYQDSGVDDPGRRSNRSKARMRAMSAIASSPGTTYAPFDAFEDATAEASSTVLGREGSATARTWAPGASKAVIAPMTSWYVVARAT